MQKAVLNHNEIASLLKECIEIMTGLNKHLTAIKMDKIILAAEPDERAQEFDHGQSNPAYMAGFCEGEKAAGDVDVEAVREVIAELRQASWDEQNAAHRFHGDQADKLAAAIGDWHE